MHFPSRRWRPIGLPRCYSNAREPRQARFALEVLESRTVLSGVYVPPTTPYIPILPTAVSGPAGSAPATPSNVSAKAVSDTQINLTWQLNDATDQAVEVLRSAVAGGTYGVLAVLPAGTTIFTDGSCYPGMTYSYRVAALNPVGASALSPQVQAATMASLSTLAAPANLRATANNPTTVTLSFADTNPYVQLPISIDATNRSLVTSTGAPFTTANVGQSLQVVGRSWWYLTIAPNSNGQVISDSHNPFTQASVGLTMTVAGGSGWIAGNYRIVAVDPSGKATLNAPAASATTTAQGSANDGWTTGSYKVLAVDGQGRATLSAAPTAAGNPNGTVASTGTSLNSGIYTIERSADGISYRIVGDLTNSSTSLSWTDQNLTPGTSYSYRVRLDSYTAGLSDYTPPAAVTTLANPAGAPATPAALSVVNNGPTSNTLTWSGQAGTATVKIERAPYSWTGTPTWTVIGATAPGATSYTDTTAAAESFYYYRICASVPSGDSPFTAPIVARTSSVGTGSPKVYNIGPGYAYADLNALNWAQLGPGDIVYIHPNKDASGNLVPYSEKLLISVRGTQANPIQVIGVPDPATGAMPVIDGQGATTAAQFASHYIPLESASVLLVGTRPNNNQSGWNPGYLDISGLEITGGYQGDSGGLTYTNSQGAVATYGIGSAGIYLEKADHLTISGCDIHGNGNGIFGAAQDDSRELANIVLQGNNIHGDGVPGSSQEHEVYLEGVNVTYQGNIIGPTRGGGDALKDRSVGTVISDNWIIGGGHLIDLDESANQQARALTLPGYYTTYVSGNVLYNPAPAAGGSVTPINYGGDLGLTAAYRNGTLYFNDNTILNVQNQAESWDTTVFRTDSPGQTVQAWNNIIETVPSTAGQPPAEMDLLPQYGVASFGQNWLSAGWQANRQGVSFTGVTAGTANFITNAGNLPASVNIAALISLLQSGLPGSGPSVPAPPSAIAHAATTPMGKPVAVAVLAGASDAAGYSLIVSSVTQGAGGVVAINADGTVTYTPRSGFIGPDAFTFTLSDGHGGTATASVTVTVASPPPVAANVAAGTTSGSGVVINVLAGASDAAGYSLIVSSVTQGAGGVVVINADGTVTYTPRSGFIGPDAFTFTLSDGHGGTATASASVAVTAPAKPYYIDNAGPGYSEAGPYWVTGWGSSGYGNSYRYHNAGSGADAATWSLSGLAAGSYQVFATWVTDPGVSVVTYRASDAPYAVFDGSAALGTVVVNQKLSPSDVTDQGVGWQSLGTFSIVSGQLRVSLTDNANGRVEADAIRVVWVGAAPAAVASPPPVAANVAAGTTSGSGVVINVLAGASDAAGYSLIVSSVTQGAGGVVVINADGTVTYTPRSGFIGPDAFTFTLSDGHGGTATASASVAVTAPAKPYYIDNAGPGYSEAGPYWVTGWGSSGYGNSYRYHNAGSGADAATWSLSGLAAGSYQVFATWVTDPGVSVVTYRASDAPYAVFDGSAALGTVVVNQKLSPSDVTDQGVGWQSLGTFSIVSGQLRVSLTDNANGRVEADAIRVVWVGAAPAAVDPLGNVSSVLSDTNGVVEAIVLDPTAIVTVKPQSVSAGTDSTTGPLGDSQGLATDSVMKPVTQ